MCYGNDEVYVWVAEDWCLMISNILSNKYLSSSQCSKLFHAFGNSALSVCGNGSQENMWFLSCIQTCQVWECFGWLTLLLSVPVWRTCKSGKMPFLVLEKWQFFSFLYWEKRISPWDTMSWGFYRRLVFFSTEILFPEFVPHKWLTKVLLQFPTVVNI